MSLPLNLSQSIISLKGKHLALNKKLIVLLISTRDLDNALVRFAHS